VVRMNSLRGILSREGSRNLHVGLRDEFFAPEHVQGWPPKRAKLKPGVIREFGFMLRIMWGEVRR
jgi:hypothetical protein